MYIKIVSIPNQKKPARVCKEEISKLRTNHSRTSRSQMHQSKKTQTREGGEKVVSLFQARFGDLYALESRALHTDADHRVHSRLFFQVVFVDLLRAPEIFKCATELKEFRRSCLNSSFWRSPTDSDRSRTNNHPAPRDCMNRTQF